MSPKRGRGEQPMVPDATFDSYYGRPILKDPVWKPLNIAGYLFTGGLAGASSLLAAGAQVTGRRTLADRAKVVALLGIGASAVALIDDLGVPERFYNMLRVFKPTSPMSVGSWLLAMYGPAAGVAATTAMTGWFPGLGSAATLAAGALGPAVATYTAVLFSDTAVPAWHDGARELPFVFAGSAASAAGGAGLMLAPTHEAGPARRLAVGGAIAEFVAAQALKRELGLVKETYETGRAGRLLKIGESLAGAGVVLALVGRRRRSLSALGGLLMVIASAVTRFGIFHAGIASIEDPKYTVQPQRDRLAEPQQDTAARSASGSSGQEAPANKSSIRS
jgi:DMSO reductase anchor subunit